MTTEPIWVEAWMQPWRLPRIQLHRNFAPERYRTKLVVAGVGRVLANPDGTGRIYVPINRMARRQLR